MNETALTRIEQIAEETRLTKLEKLPEMRRTIALANGMRELQKLLSGDVLESVCALSDSNLGFRTDKAGKGGYPKEVVRDVLIEAMIRGASPIGNEFNIIAGRLYLTKEYFERAVRELVDELRVIEGVPQKSGDGALVPMRATWIYKGNKDSVECTKNGETDNRIAVRVNAGMGVDAILGKARRKLLARIYSRVTGSHWAESDADATDEAVVDVEATEASAPGIDWDAIWQGLTACTTITEVNECVELVQSECPEMSESDSLQLDEWAQQRSEAIRAERGERSNG